MSFDVSRNDPRHPFCTCPDLTWDGIYLGNVPDYEACRARTPFGIDPHPVLIDTYSGLVEFLKGIKP